MDKEMDDSFWNPKSAEQLAAEQGIDRPQSLDALIGSAADLWSSDEEFHEFLTSIDRHRREPAPT